MDVACTPQRSPARRLGAHEGGTFSSEDWNRTKVNRGLNGVRACELSQDHRGWPGNVSSRSVQNQKRPSPRMEFRILFCPRFVESPGSLAKTRVDGGLRVSQRHTWFETGVRRQRQRVRAGRLLALWGQLPGLLRQEGLWGLRDGEDGC